MVSLTIWTPNSMHTLGTLAVLTLVVSHLLQISDNPNPHACLMEYVKGSRKHQSLAAFVKQHILLWMQANDFKLPITEICLEESEITKITLGNYNQTPHSQLPLAKYAALWICNFSLSSWILLVSHLLMEKETNGKLFENLQQTPSSAWKR